MRLVLSWSATGIFIYWTGFSPELHVFLLICCTYRTPPPARAVRQTPKICRRSRNEHECRCQNESRVPSCGNTANRISRRPGPVAMRLLQELLFIKFYRVRGLLRTAFAISNLDFHAPSRIVLKEMAFTSHPDAVLEQL